MPATATRNVSDEMERFARLSSQGETAKRNPRLHGFLADVTGVIHVGAHTGQERDIYGELPVVWIEALEPIYSVLCEQIADKPNQRAYRYLVADGKTHRFGLASNSGQSSSIYDFAGHKKLWPEVGYIASTEMQSKTLRDIIDFHGIDLNIHDALILDVQGAELLVLQGAGDYLSCFRWVMAEAADFEAYAGGCQLQDLDEHMARHGFVRDKLFRGNSLSGVGTYYEALWYNARTLHRGTMQTLTESPNGKHVTNRLPETTVEPLRLNLGAGRVDLPGFTNVDRKTGNEVYPLSLPNESVEEIVASHVLEHFSHREIRAVLTDWVRVLKPGGKIRIAVPDTEEVARLYLAGAPVNIQGYLMGGHNDADDFHRCLFDKESLVEEMMSVGLERIGPWDAPASGCAAGPHSLNLQGFKPSGPEQKLSGVRAVMSVPRFGPLMHPRCAERAFFQLGIEARSTSSCYWAQQISNLMEDAIARPDCEFVLTMDFDTVFCAADVLELYRLLKAAPAVDAVFPMQSKRGCEEVLFSIAGKTPGTCRTNIASADLCRNLLPANSGHFGLTLFRADSLRKFPRPWMVPEANSAGLWRDGHRDADIDFWKRFRAANFQAALAPKVVVGHLEEVVKWPGVDLKPVFQTTADYEETGIPAEVAR